jgi:hypothetical protein
MSEQQQQQQQQTPDYKNMKRQYEGWRFDSFEEFLEVVETPITPAEESAWAATLASHRDDRPEWSGTDSWEQATQFAREGWDHGLASFEDELQAMSPYVTAAISVPGETLAPAGYYPNVPAFCAGTPAHMVCPGEDFNARTPVLRFLINIGGLANVDGDAWIKRGAALMSVVDYFEQSGVQCEIELVSVAQADSSVVEVNIPVKQAGEHAEPDRLAFVLGNPSMLRRFVFSLREKSTTVADAFRYGYGSSCDAQADPDQIYFPKLQNFRDAEEALEHVLERVCEYLDPELQSRVREDWSAILPQDSRVA